MQLNNEKMETVNDLIQTVIEKLICLCHTVMSISCSLEVTCLEKASLLALVCDVFCVIVTSLLGDLGQVWCLIVSIPDLCLLSYFNLH